MRIFVSFGFGERDRWIPDLVYPLLRAFECQVVDGRALQGKPINEGVARLIESSDALIGFTTRRGEAPNPGGSWPTHRWVTDEIAHASARGKVFAEVREQGVDEQGGMVGNRQRIAFDEASREKALVELAGVLGRWKRELTPVRLQLLPPESVQAIIPFHREKDLICEYRLLQAGEEGDPIQATLRPITGALFVEVRNVPHGALVQVDIRFREQRWMSSYESIDTVGVMLRASAR